MAIPQGVPRKKCCHLGSKSRKGSRQGHRHDNRHHKEDTKRRPKVEVEDFDTPTLSKSLQ